MCRLNRSPERIATLLKTVFDVPGRRAGHKFPRDLYFRGRHASDRFEYRRREIEVAVIATRTLVNDVHDR